MSSRRFRCKSLFFASLLLAACSSSKSEAPPTPGIDPDTIGLNVLGSGTDVFGLYAVESNVKGRVLDVEALNLAHQLVYSPDVQEYRYEEAAGHTISTYVGSLATGVGLTGSYMFFSAEVKAAFSQDTYRRLDYSYASIIERHWKHSLKVEPGLWSSASRLRPYLTPLARQAINDTDPLKKWSGADVIATFGTHVMNGIYMGGRLDYHLAIQILEEEHRASLMAYAKASYNSSFASAGMTFEIDTATKTAMDEYNRVGPVINAKGGASQYAHPEDDDQYKLWKASLDTNPVFCGVIEGSLLGIWELADTPERRDELYAAFTAYAVGQGAAFIPLLEKITDVQILVTAPGMPVSPPTGYELIRNGAETEYGNLNQGWLPGIGPSGIWYDQTLSNRVYLAYLSEVTAEPVGIAELHVDSTDADVSALFFGANTHDDIYGTANPGCLANADPVLHDLNSGTCKWFTAYDHLWCAYYVWECSCDGGAGTPLFLHYVKETSTPPSTLAPPLADAIRCVVVGDRVAVDSTKSLEERAAHIYWGPEDVNHDGKIDARDARWVLEHVQWLRNRTDDGLVNLNHGTQNFHRYGYFHCFFGGYAYDYAAYNAPSALEDAKYLGVCTP